MVSLSSTILRTGVKGNLKQRDERKERRRRGKETRKTVKGRKRKGRRKEEMKGICLTANSAQVKSLEMNTHVNKRVDLAQSWTTPLTSVQALWP